MGVDFGLEPGLTLRDLLGHGEFVSAEEGVDEVGGLLGRGEGFGGRGGCSIFGVGRYQCLDGGVHNNFIRSWS